MAKHLKKTKLAKHCPGKLDLSCQDRQSIMVFIWKNDASKLQPQAFLE